MTHKGNYLLYSTVFLFISLTLISSAAPVSAQSQSCNPIDGYDFCISKVEVDKNSITTGENVHLIITIQNTGQKTGSVHILGSLRQTSGEYAYWKAGVEKRVSVNETRKVHATLTSNDSTEIGVADINVLLLAPEGNHVNDSTGYSKSVVVQEPSETEDSGLWGFLNKTNIVISITVGLLTLFAIILR